jgi:pyocin large subunit-like protein
MGRVRPISQGVSAAGAGLRDAPLGGSILEAVRRDGEFTRFDKSKGYFGAYNRDRTIRTFFIPNDGERYFTAAKR